MTRSPRIPIPDGVAAAAIGAAYQPELDRRLAELHAAVLRRTSLDAETTEMVRIRCAQQHDCYG